MITPHVSGCHQVAHWKSLRVLGIDLIQCIYRDSKHVLESCSGYAGKLFSRSAPQMLRQISPVNWHVAVIGI